MKMQKPNLNQQRGSYRKRKCIVYKPNDYFESFDRSQHEVIINYEKQAEDHMVKSLSALLDIIRKTGNPIDYEPSSPPKDKAPTKNILKSITKNPLTFKKNLPEIISEEEEYTNPEKEIKEMIIFEKTGQKVDRSLQKFNICKEEKLVTSNPLQQKKHSRLLESMKKLSISDPQSELERQIENDSRQGNREPDFDNTNLLQNDESINRKTLAELIDFNAKSQKKREFSPESSDSEYIVTDHSSNSSSNDNDDYEERFAFDTDEQPLFGTIFAQGGKNYKPINQATLKFTNGDDSNSQVQQKINFKPIMDSPKKSKSKQKRLYVNKKKVPRWAEDLKDVAKIYASEHQRKLRSEFKEIFGICIVQNMQTNPIFNRNDAYVRSSTVKWSQYNEDF